MNGTIPADEFTARLNNVIIRAAMKRNTAMRSNAQPADVGWGWDVGAGAAAAAPEVTQALNSLGNSSSSSSGSGAVSSNRTVSLAASGSPGNAQPAGSIGNSQATTSSSSSSGAADNPSDRPTGTVSAAFFGGGWGGGIDPWNGWGYCGGSCGAGYGGYYKWWKEHYFLRNLYMNLRIPPKTNPCKFYKVRSAGCKFVLVPSAPAYSSAAVVNSKLAYCCSYACCGMRDACQTLLQCSALQSHVAAAAAA
jgi:hypothetical protein